MIRSKKVFFALIIIGIIIYIQMFMEYDKKVFRPNRPAVLRTANLNSELITEIVESDLSDADFQFENETLFSRLHDLNYFGDLKTNKIYENGLCRLPKLNPWDPKIKALLKPIPVYDKCVKHRPLTYIQNNLLFIDQTIAKTYYRNQISHCKFAPVLRSAIQKESYILGEFKQFNSSLELIDEVVKVNCYNTAGKLEYDYVHTAIFRKEKLKEKETASKRINVLIMIFDSMSSSSFKRALPKTYQYLQSFTNFHHFDKYHTVGENTLPNLVPMLSGLQAEKLLGTENVPPPFDDFPFIWQNFSQKNYVTYMNEDWRNSMFNFNKFGFRHMPMDYWQRHYWLSLYDSKTAAPNSQNSNMNPCYYDTLYHKLGFRWLADFLKEYSPSASAAKTTQNLFGIFKSNEMSHDYLERLFWIDDDLKSLLQEIFTESFLDNTLFILMGDHGHRFHGIRQTVTGKQEQKRPSFSMLLPRKLTKQNSFLNDVLKQNSQTLITSYEIYETLRQLLIDQLHMDPATSNYLQEKSERRSKEAHLGYSLLMPVPYRNCEQALIPDYLCSCEIDPKEKLTEADTKVATVGSHFLVDHINNFLLKEHSNICVKYELKSLKDFEIIDKQLNKYSIIFETSPNDATFDGRVILKDIDNPQLSSKFQVIGQITRISLYGDTSSCMPNYLLKNYCYCSFNLNSTKSIGS